MSNNKISQIKLPNNNEIYDIEGRNIQRISWNDYSNLSEEDKKSNTAYYITNIPLDEGGYKHAEGSVISIDDGKLNEPLKACTVDINPVQDLHGYDHPWVGGAEKNKCDTKGYAGIGYNGAVGTEVTFTDSTTTVTVNKNIINYSVAVWGGVVFKTASLPSGTYHFHAEFSSTVNKKTFYVINSNKVFKELTNLSDSRGTLNIFRTH